jgi:hypothetical protein
VLYWTLKKEVLGMTGMLLINIVILLIISETEFRFPKETLTGLNSYFMTLFTSVGNGICITTLCWLVKKQENFD